MEFNRQQVQPLPALSVTRHGFERITSVLQNRFSNYDTDIFTPILHAIGAAAGRRIRTTAAAITWTSDAGGRGSPPRDDVSHRGRRGPRNWRGRALRGDHAARCATARSLVRPAGAHSLVDAVVEDMADAYPSSATATRSQSVRSEEERSTRPHRRPPGSGRTARRPARASCREDAFRLTLSLGVPPDFMEDTASSGPDDDREGYDSRDGAAGAGRQRRRVRQTDAQEFAFTFEEARGGSWPRRISSKATRAIRSPASPSRLRRGSKETLELKDGQSGFIVPERTPFYPERAGSVRQRVIANDATARRRRWPGPPLVERLRAHRVTVSAGCPGCATSSPRRSIYHVRDATRRTTPRRTPACGCGRCSHARQAGGVAGGAGSPALRLPALRGDPAREPDRIERIVNEQIDRNTTVQTDVRSTQEAMASGAMAPFGRELR